MKARGSNLSRMAVEFSGHIGSAQTSLLSRGTGSACIVAHGLTRGGDRVRGVGATWRTGRARTISASRPGPSDE